MNSFDRLLDIAETLLGPNGCPWDKEQTFATLQPYLLEETYELLEALDLQDPKKISEELGDCLYALVFMSKLAEQKEIFTLQEALDGVADKLIRRHPHIFNGTKVESAEDVVRKWEEIKKQEGKKHPIDGIPPALPSLARAQKVIHKIRRSDKKPPVPTNLESDEELGRRLWELVREAESAGLDAESALRRVCLKHEREWSKNF